MKSPTGPPVLDLLTRYAARVSNDPAEDRATAVLAALLRADLACAKGLMEAWGLPTFEPVAITPQRPVRRANGDRIRIDLEIRGPAHRIWVEVKYLAGLSGGTQLQTYAKELANPVFPEARKHVLLLVPAWRVAHFPPLPRADQDAVWDDQPRIATWQDALAALMRQRPLSGSARWLRSEALKFYEGMDMLPAQRLQAKDVKTLRSLRQTLSALDGLLDAASGELQREDALRPVRGGIYREAGYTEITFQLPKDMPWARGSRLYFGVDYDTCFAGIRLSTGRAEDSPSFDRYVDANWKYEGRELWRSSDLEQIVQAPGQRDALCRFVRETFQQLRAGPEPAMTGRPEP